MSKAGLLDKAIEAYRQARLETEDGGLRAESWRLESIAQQSRGSWNEAEAAARESARIAREIGRKDLLAQAMNAEAAVHYGRGAFEEAIPLYTGMLELTEAPRIRGLALQNLGIIHGRRGELELADRRLTEALDEFERAGYEWGKAHVLNNRVGVALDRQDYAAAKEVAREAIGVARLIDDLDLLAVATLNYSEALAGLGDLDAAEEEASTALGYFQTAGNRWRRIGCYQTLGDLNQRRGDLPLARRFWTDGLKLARELGATGEAARLEERLAASAPPDESDS